MTTQRLLVARLARGRLIAPRAGGQRPLIVLLAGAMLALTPAAHASPPDQSWIAGLYDNADYDDAVLAIIAGVASLDLRPTPDPQRVAFVVIGCALPVGESLHATPPLSPNQTRGPPS